MTLARSFLFAFAVAAGSSHSAMAWQPASTAVGPLGEYVASIRASGAAVFMSACQLNESIKAVVVFRTGATSGDFFTISDRLPDGNAAAGRMGQVSVQNGTPEVLWTNASQDAADVFEKLALNLLGYPFWVVPIDRVDAIFAEPAQESC